MSETTTEAPAEIGHNVPPTDAEIVQAKLAEEHADLVIRQEDLIEAFDRVPPECDEDSEARFTDFISQINNCQKVAEALRVAAKAPSIAEGKAIDGFFKPPMDDLDTKKKKVNVTLTKYQREKADAERRAREEEARIAREEARAAEQRLADAKAANDKQALDEAIAAEEVAKKAETAAVAKPSEMSRSRGTMGGTASLRTRWTGEVNDRAMLDLEQLREHIGLEALNIAVRSYVKAGGRELDGALIHEVSDTVVS